MKHSILLILVLLSFNSFATVSIQNFSSLHEEENVFRGKEPGNKIKELAKLNVTDVIIFKNDTKGEVENELSDLESIGITGHHIPFYWKDIPSMQVACEQVIEALTIIKNVREEGGSVYFHCTVGEDRTGLLAGLFQMINNGEDLESAFEEEMCAKGYSDGNPRKPIQVTSAIEKGLTPLFLTLASKIESGELSLNKLDKKICRNIKLIKQIKRCK